MVPATHGRGWVDDGDRFGMYKYRHVVHRCLDSVRAHSHIVHG